MKYLLVQRKKDEDKFLKKVEKMIRPNNVLVSSRCTSKPWTLGNRENETKSITKNKVKPNI